MSRLFLSYLFIYIDNLKKKHITIGAILTLLIFLLSSVLFISSSLQHSLKDAISGEPDFIVKRFEGGREQYTPISWEDKILNIYGISSVTKRIYGRYFFDKEHFALIVGVDVLDEQNNHLLRDTLKKSNLKSFINGKYMIVGKGVLDYFSQNNYTNFYNFITPKGDMIRLNTLESFDSNSSVVSNDFIIVPMNTAREILGIPKGFVSDITFNVNSKEEEQTVALKLSELFFNAKIITKDEYKRYINSLFNYKGGLFLMLFMTALVTFALILYHRFSLVYSSEKREIAILRATGWSIKDVLLFKFLESAMLFFVTFAVAIFLAFVYVFYLGAPILKGIFLGSYNLKNFATFDIYIDTTIIFSLFLLFGVLFVGSVLVPTWKIAVTNPKEAMK